MAALRTDGWGLRERAGGSPKLDQGGGPPAGRISTALAHLPRLITGR
ncbi:hypothetical protein ACH41E_17290 [Streptomyces sp. NPDC020412]